MKIFNWIQQHKYPLMVAAFFIAVAMVLYFFFQGLKKDHTLEMTLQKLELKEEARQKEIVLRAQFQKQYEDVSKQVLVKEITDSIKAANAEKIQLKINTIQSPTYAKEKIAPVYNYSDTELSDFYNNLPDTRQPNDY